MELENELTCSICLELLDSPVILPCSHNFCRECVIGLLKHGEFKCPTCRRQCGHRCIDDFQSNRALANIVADYKKRQVLLCSEHDKRLSLFCVSCRTAVCRMCLHARKGEHRGHTAKQLKPLCEKEKKRLTSEHDSLKTLVDEVKSRFNPSELMEEVEEDLSSIEEQLDQTCEELIRMIKQRKVSIKSMIKFQRDKIRWKLDSHKSSIKQSQNLLDKYQKVTSLFDESPVRFLQESLGLQGAKLKISALKSIDLNQKPLKSKYLHSWKIKNALEEMTLNTYPEPPIKVCKFGPQTRMFGNLTEQNNSKATPFTFKSVPWRLGISMPRVNFEPTVLNGAKFLDDASEMTSRRSQSVTAMKQYENFSFEEIRLEDYLCDCRDVKSRGGCTWGCCDKKFVPPTGSDTILQAGVSVMVSTRFNCITSMKEYEGISFEELRMKDYQRGRGRSRLDFGGTSFLESTFGAVSLNAPVFS